MNLPPPTAASRAMPVVAIRAFGDVEVLQDEAWPVPEPGHGEVRVAIEAASFNPIDLYWRSGRLDNRLPVVLGRDFAGVVDALGDGVAGLSVGQAVYGYQAGLASNGSYAAFTCLPAKLVAARPRRWSAAQAAAAPVAGLTAYAAVHEKARLQTGQSVLVAGAAGGVGAVIVQLARLAGAAPIVATAGSDHSAARLTDELGLPADALIRYPGRSVEELAAEVRQRNGGQGVAVAFDTAGGAMKRLAFAAAAVDGQVVSIVEEPADFDLNIWDERTSPLSLKALSFHFVELSARARAGGPAALDFYRTALDWLTARAEAGELLPPAVERVGGLSAGTARAAHERLATRHAGAKLVMEVNQ